MNAWPDSQPVRIRDMAITTVVVGPSGGLATALTDDLRAANADGVVIIVGSDPETGPIGALSPDDWDRLVDTTMWDTLTALQQAHSSFRQTGGRIVLVVPTVGICGAPQLVAYTTAVEGIRAMAKSAARQWLSKGVAVNIVAAPMSDPASQDDTSLVGSVVESVKFLLQPVDHLVGETIIVDGGSVMLP